MVNILRSSDESVRHSLAAECSRVSGDLPMLSVACHGESFSPDGFAELYQLFELYPDSSELVLKYKNLLKWTPKRNEQTTGSEDFDKELGLSLIIAEIRIGVSEYEYFDVSDNEFTIGGEASALVYDTAESGADPSVMCALAGFTVTRTGEVILHDTLSID